MVAQYVVPGRGVVIEQQRAYTVHVDVVGKPHLHRLAAEARDDRFGGKRDQPVFAAFVGSERAGQAVVEEIGFAGSIKCRGVPA